MLWVDTLATTTHPVPSADEGTWCEHTLEYCSIAIIAWTHFNEDLADTTSQYTSEIRTSINYNTW